MIGGLAFGMIWLALSGIAYTHHIAPGYRHSGWRGSAGGVVNCRSWQVVNGYAPDAARWRVAYRNPQYADTIGMVGEGWQTLPAWRTTWRASTNSRSRYSGRARCKQSAVAVAAGWRVGAARRKKPAALVDTTRARWRYRCCPACTMAATALALIRPVAGQPGQRMVLRLWPSDAVIQQRPARVWNGW